MAEIIELQCGPKNVLHLEKNFGMFDSRVHIYIFIPPDKLKGGGILVFPCPSIHQPTCLTHCLLVCVMFVGVSFR